MSLAKTGSFTYYYIISNSRMKDQDEHDGVGAEKKRFSLKTARHARLSDSSGVSPFESTHPIHLQIIHSVNPRLAPSKTKPCQGQERGENVQNKRIVRRGEGGWRNQSSQRTSKAGGGEDVIQIWPIFCESGIDQA